MLEWDILNYLKKWRTNLRATITGMYISKSSTDYTESHRLKVNIQLFIEVSVQTRVICGEPYPVEIQIFHYSSTT